MVFYKTKVERERTMKMGLFLDWCLLELEAVTRFRSGHPASMSLIFNVPAERDSSERPSDCISNGTYAAHAHSTRVSAGRLHHSSSSSRRSIRPQWPSRDPHQTLLADAAAGTSSGAAMRRLRISGARRVGRSMPSCAGSTARHGMRLRLLLLRLSRHDVTPRIS